MENYKTVYLDIDIYETLKRQSEQTGQTINSLLKGMAEVIEYLEEAEEDLKESGFYG